MSEHKRAARTHRVREAFEGALECDDFEARKRYVDQACEDDPESRAEVERLLRNHSQIADKISATLPRFGPYQASRQIGRGGMGVVYEAHRADGEFDRRVAVKVLAAATLGTEFREEIRRERQILAGLMHPSIAQLFDGGTTEGGEPYLVVEYVEGEHLDVYCDRRNLDVTARLKLFDRVLDAIEYAHQIGVAHWDLKPSNILIRADGQPKLVDFGTAQMLHTGTGEASRCFTPEYGSPEIAAGGKADARSDIYSLGVIYRNILGKDARPEIVRQATEPEPALRYPDISALRRAILSRRWPLWILAASAIVLAAAGATWYFATRPAVLRALHPASTSWKDAVVSWDGSTLAFTAGDGTANGRAIWTSGPNGENAQSLFADQIKDGDPTLSPDGRFVAFRSDTEPVGIHEFDRRTGARRPLVPGGHRPLYSPNGQWLLYATGDDRDDPSRASGATWWVVPARGGSPVPVGGKLRYIESVLWSADGASILFQGNEQLMKAYSRIWRHRVNQGQPGNSLELAVEWDSKDSKGVWLKVCAAEPKGDSVLAITSSKEPVLTRISLRNPAQMSPVARIPAGAAGCLADRHGRIYLTRQRLSTRHFVVSPTGPDPKAVETFLPEVAGFDREEPWSVASASRDGRVIAYYSSQQVQRALVQTPQGIQAPDHRSAFVSGDGRFVWFRSGGDTSIIGKAALAKLQVPVLEFPVPAIAWGVSSDGSRLFGTVHPSVPRAISVIDSNSRINLIYRHKAWNLYRARPSADDRWVAFTAHDTALGLRVFVAPFRGEQAVPDSEWIEIGEGTAADFSPAGDRIYFASERDGHWCLYQRNLDAATKRPTGPVLPLVHLHSDFSAAQLPYSSFNMASSTDGLRFSLGRMSYRVFRVD